MCVYVLVGCRLVVLITFFRLIYLNCMFLYHPYTLATGFLPADNEVDVFVKLWNLFVYNAFFVVVVVVFIYIYGLALRRT